MKAVESLESHIVRLVYLAPIRTNLCLSGPLTVNLDKFERVDQLPIPNQSGRRPRQFSPVVGAYCIRRSVLGRPVKKKNHALDFMKLYKICALPAQLLSAQKIATARRERSAASWHVQSIETGKAEMHVKELVGLFLQPSVRAGHYQRVRTIRRPSEMSHFRRRMKRIYATTFTPRASTPNNHWMFRLNPAGYRTGMM